MWKQKGMRYCLSACVMVFVLSAFVENSHGATAQEQVLLDLQEQIMTFRKEFKQRTSQAQEDRAAVYKNIHEKFNALNDTRVDLNESEPDLLVQLKKIQPMLEKYGEQIEVLEGMMTAMETTMHGRLDELEAHLHAEKASASGRPLPRQTPAGAASAIPSQGTGNVGEEGGEEEEENSLDLSEGELFRLAYRFYTEGDYDVAVGGFQKYLNDFPQGQLAGPAQYWIAESFLKLEDFEIARQEFERLIANYPRDNKVPDAHYGIGVALQKLGYETEAQAKFQYVLEHFSGSIAAERAQRRLEF